jgi:hypothetical protein
VNVIYSTLRAIMIAIGITPPPPGKEKWVAIVFFGVSALMAIGGVLLGAWLLRALAK